MKNISKITFITANPGKLKEAAFYLKHAGVAVIGKKLELDEVQDIDPKRVVEHKVRSAKAKGLRNFILEDSALTIHGMGKLPGALIKWFGKEMGNGDLYHLSSRMGNGKAVAMTIFAYCDKSGRVSYFSGRTAGSITTPRGRNGFGWDQIFRPEGAYKTFAEMDPEEKEAWSMRTKALKKLADFLA